MKLYRGHSILSGFIASKEWFVYSGQKRAPKKGEYFLSGAKPEVYLAHNDMTSVYHIMVKTTPPPKQIQMNGLTYILSC